MNSVPLSKLILFVGIYAVASIVTAFSLQSTVGTAEFEDLANSTLQSQEVEINKLQTSGSVNPFEGAAPPTSITSGKDNLQFLLKTFSLQSPIWESQWANIIRLVLWVIAVIMGIYIGFEGVKVLQGFIPLT